MNNLYYIRNVGCDDETVGLTQIPDEYFSLFRDNKKNYPAKDETAVDKWRRRHKRCAWCTHCKSSHIFNPNSLSIETRYNCEAKKHWDIEIDRPRPFCTLFILKNGSNKND